MYGSSTRSTLGTVPATSEETFTFLYSAAGDLRLTGDFIQRRTASSNPIQDLRAGDRLVLTINQRGELRLDKAPEGL